MPALSLDWKATKLYRLRADIEEVIRGLKQECGWPGVQQRSLHNHERQLTLGLMTYLLLHQLAKQHKTGVYVLRRRLIAGKVPLSSLDVQLIAAA